MKKVFSFSIIFVLIILFLITAIANTQQLKSIKLLSPQTDGGKPLMQALKARSSSREFSTKKLPPQVLSNLLWAAFGINRPESGKRTAPSAMNWQEIDIYVSTADGVYLYDAKEHTLNPVMTGDIREATGKQEFVKVAAVNLIFVADYSKMTTNDENKAFMSAADTGFISQNVYLFCASEGLATVVRGWVDKPALKKLLNLRPEQNIVLTQSVGYPE